MNEIPDHLRKGLNILFVGFNPSLRSAQTGHHYANPNNRFWKIIHEAGLTDRRYQPQEDGDLLELGYGFTNIVPRPTKTAAEITKEEYRRGAIELRDKISSIRPQVVCYVGKGVYEQFSGSKGMNWGEQHDSVVPGVIDFVAPSSSGLVRMPMKEIIAIYAQLKRHIQRHERE